MTERHRKFALLGFHYDDGRIEQESVVVVPTTGRLIVKTRDGYESQPWNDNYWCSFSDLLDAATAATSPNLRFK